MKTSNKVMFVAAFITVAYLMIYDLGLKSEYDKGAFRKRFYNMVPLTFNGFNSIQHNAGNIIGLQIEKGPYGVWVDKDLKDKISITQHGQSLQIDYVEKDGHYNNGYGTPVIISCPEVAAVISNPFAMSLGESNGYLRKKGKSMLIDYFPHGVTTIAGFDQFAMTVRAARHTEIVLAKNTIGTLTATVGDKTNGEAGLTIDANNNINSANFQIPGKSSLTLDNVLIGHINYRSTDSAQVTLAGKASHLLDRQ